MLKFFNVVRISNFHIFLVNLSLDLEHIVLSHLDVLLSLRYMVRKLQISSFEPNYNLSKIQPVALDLSQIVH